MFDFLLYRDAGRRDHFKAIRWKRKATRIPRHNEGSTSCEGRGRERDKNSFQEG